MEDVDDQPRVIGTIDEVYRAEFPRLVRSLAMVDGPEAAADAVQEAFIAADRGPINRMLQDSQTSAKCAFSLRKP